MEARSQKIKGLNLNPLAPAQSKRTFAFSGKTQKIIRNAYISSPFFASFCIFFETFREKRKNKSRVRPQGHKSTSKWTSRAPKRSPRINNLRPKVPPSTNSRGRVLAEGDVDSIEKQTTKHSGYGTTHSGYGTTHSVWGGGNLYVEGEPRTNRLINVI